MFEDHESSGTDAVPGTTSTVVPALLALFAILVCGVAAPLIALVLLPSNLRALSVLPILLCARYVMGKTWVESIVLLLFTAAVAGGMKLLLTI